MSLSEYLVDPRAFVLPFGGEPRPLGLIDLNRTVYGGPLALPPYPLIGIGDDAHPLAPQLDVVVARPENLVAHVTAKPKAAAVAVQLLRQPPTLLTESMAYGLLQGGDEHAAWLAEREPPALFEAGKVSAVRNGHALDVCLDRPEANNAIDRSMRDGLREAFELAALDNGVERIMLRSIGRAFSVGADLAEFGITRDPPMAHAIRMVTLPAHALALCAGRLEVQIQGACVGAGLEMAAFAHRITASPRAWFQLPELVMGLIPGAGGCVSVRQRIGRQRTTWLILSGRRIDARTALAWGLVDALVDD